MDARRPPRELGNGNHKGQCRYCGLLIQTANGMIATRNTWHPECVEIWNIATRGEAARNALLLRDRGVCASCGTACVHWQAGSEHMHFHRQCRLSTNVLAWEADHIFPLAIAPMDMWYWGLENLQTLCEPCHKIKTKRDMVLIYATRKARVRTRGYVLDELDWVEASTGELHALRVRQ